MNRRTSQVIVVTVLAVLIIMFGVGMFFAGPVSAPITPSQTSTGGNASLAVPTAPQATQVVQYVAQMPIGSSTPVEQGSCWTNSIAAPFRGDAWRCMVGNNISDPCFQIPGQQKLLCNVNPLDPASTSTFVLALTKPLPQSQPVQGLQPSGNGWLIELQGGTLCTPFTGTLPIAEGGMAASYACAPGPLGKDVSIFTINSSSSVWTAEIGTITSAPANSTSGLPVVTNIANVPITEVWQ